VLKDFHGDQNAPKDVRVSEEDIRKSVMVITNKLMRQDSLRFFRVSQENRAKLKGGIVKKEIKGARAKIGRIVAKGAAPTIAELKVEEKKKEEKEEEEAEADTGGGLLGLGYGSDDK